MIDTINTRDERANRERTSSKRQVILSGRKGRTYSDFIQQSSNSTVDIIATENDPLIVSIADGFNEYGPKDYVGRITESITNIPIENNRTNFIGLERDANGQYSVVKTPIEPMYGSHLSSDRQNKICATFNGLNGSNVFTDYYGNVFRFYGNSGISNVFPIYGANAARFGGAVDDFCLVKPNLNTSDLEEWTIEFDIKFNSLGTLQTIFTTVGDPQYTITFYRQGGNTLHLYMGNGSNSWITALNPLNITTDGVSGTFNTTNIYKIAVVFDRLLVKVYVDGYLRAHTNNLFTLNNYRLPHFDSFMLGNGTDYNSGVTRYPLNGYIANFQFWPYAKYQDQPNSYLRTTNASLPTGRVYPPILAPAVEDTVNPERYLKNESISYVPFTGDNGSVKFDEYYGKKVFSSYSGSDTVVQPYIDTSIADPFGNNNGILKRVGSVYSANFTSIPVNLNLSNWTIEFWYRPGGVSGGIARTLLHADSNFSISIAVGTTNLFTLAIGMGGGAWNIINSLSSTTVASPGNWYHLSVTYDGATYRFFINGNLEISVSSLLTMYKPQAFTIGNPVSDTCIPFDSWYSDFAVYPYCKYNSSFTTPTSRIQPESFYYYDITKAKMYSGVLGNLEERKVIFIGEVTNERGTIEEVISYSLNGKVTVPYFGRANENSFRPPGGAYTGFAFTNLNHNIGCRDININSEVIFYRNYLAYEPYEKLLNYNTIDAGGNTYTNPFSVVDRNKFSIIASSGNFSVPSKSSGTIVGTGQENPGYVIELSTERTW